MKIRTKSSSLVLSLILTRSRAFLSPHPVATIRNELFDSRGSPTVLHRKTHGIFSSISNNGLENQEEDGSRNSLDWVNLGLSGIYLSHFASLYTQLPGLFGSTGLLPIEDRVDRLQESLWMMSALSSPQLGMEIFAALGILVSAAQIGLKDLRRGLPGAFAFGLNWILWHDLVIAGGRFTAYQMDILLLDAAPMAVLAALTTIPTSVAMFGYRWLLSRLYLGAGAVKLLSCDASWRDLNAIHIHFQSQPLPNFIGAAAFQYLPQSFGQALTLIVLVVEMAAPYLFLAPSREIRRIVFVCHVLLMVGIAIFGNFGPLQALLIVVGFALLDDLPRVPGGESWKRSGGNAINMAPRNDVATVEDTATNLARRDRASEVGSASSSSWKSLPQVLSAVSVALAAGAAVWTVVDVNSLCQDTWAVDPLVYDLTLYGAAIAALPLFTPGGSIGAAFGSLILWAGSAPTMAKGLGVLLPFRFVLDLFDLGTASPYGLFATITGVDGRPVAAVEAATQSSGPWKYIPFLYQINDPTASLPLCFLHFPRLDWTIWFVPLGERGEWVGRLLQGIAHGDSSVLSLLDRVEFQKRFPPSEEPPAIVRIVPRTYELVEGQANWRVDLPDESLLRSGFLYDRGDTDDPTTAPLEHTTFAEENPWPSLPILRSLANAGRPEYFVWGCLSASETLRYRDIIQDERLTKDDT